MIRLAFLGVLVLAGLLAFGGFSLMRNTGAPLGDAGTQATIASPDPAPAAPPAVVPEVEKLYFLRDIDFTGGGITLVLFDTVATGETVVIRDQSRLETAQDSAFVNIETGAGDGGFVFATEGVPISKAFAHIYRDDLLIAAVMCARARCSDFSENPDVFLGDLPDTAIPIAQVVDTFDTYEDYRATITAIAQDPDYMFLHARPDEPFPAPRRLPTLTVRLPDVIRAADTPLVSQEHESRVRDALTPLLPDGAAIDWIRITGPQVAILGDKDNNRAVLINGEQVPFPYTHFYSVQSQISGTTTLPTAAYDTLTQSTLDRRDTERDFATFVHGILGADACMDCYFLKADEGFSDTAYADDWRAETYTLTYYDLRDAP